MVDEILLDSDSQKRSQTTQNESDTFVQDIIEESLILGDGFEHSLGNGVGERTLVDLEFCESAIFQCICEHGIDAVELERITHVQIFEGFRDAVRMEGTRFAQTRGFEGLEHIKRIIGI